MLAITLAQNAILSTQLAFPSGSQADSVQSPATMQTFSTTSTLCSAVPPTNAGSREVRAIPKPRPKRRLKPEGPSIPEHIKNRDLQWFKAQLEQLAAARNSKIASPVADPTGTFVLLNNAAGAPAAEKPKPSRMPGRIYPRPSLSGPMTANQPTAAEIIYQTSTFARVPAPVDIKRSNGERITPAVTDINMSDSQLENVPRDPEKHPSSAPENVAPNVTMSSLKQTTDFLASTKPPGTPSNHLVVKQGEFQSYPVTTPQVNSPRFGGQMVMMIYWRGLASALETLNITFNLDSHYSQIAQWAKSKHTKSSLSSDLEQSVCVSFACYHLPSLPFHPLEGDRPTPCFETLMYSPCTWPTSGDVSLQTKRNGKDFIIPLAPPLFVTPDNCIDISAFIRGGENKFSVVHQSDISDYLFVLHVHHPTPEQLSYLASCRHRREEWVKSMSDLRKFEPKESSWRQ
ncbi:uncharacterized protein F5891DRAFT_667903 [Suillus fuscotomentosus]|uniref:Uncharacterized protein n=1 Tax=Suillus fuscotomentosus TaxID=1912939 RepID=A0AAD4DYZ8_9AGAM|nr:uncharacterized protein F5891DRAFT_667903 [Suillus fuscotomentosus]KAG1895459.1 hypothetical protein F5891DRAFT_667903 [Suillus fuscotomentosus]